MSKCFSSPDRGAHRSRIFTSESVTEGHPDKVADAIADAVLDAYLRVDPEARVACEVLCKGGMVVLGGEVDAVDAEGSVDHVAVVREAVRRIGYEGVGGAFRADQVVVVDAIGKQSTALASSLTRTGDLAAGDQGLVFGYATDETPELMPLPILAAHRITAGLAQARKSGAHPWLGPDGKSQVSVRYEGDRPVGIATVVVSAQHRAGMAVEEVQRLLREELVPAALGELYSAEIEVIANPAGEFVLGGPEADCGVTGRKIIVDTYGGMARHGGGAFSGKDATKVDRSAAYFARFVARAIVLRGLAARAELQICYAIGQAHPVALHVDTFGTGDAAAAEEFARTFDYRPAAIIERLGLRRPVYSETTHYGHFGKPQLPWEA